jgi:hypothetical protein
MNQSNIERFKKKFFILYPDVDKLMDSLEEGELKVKLELKEDIINQNRYKAGSQLTRIFYSPIYNIYLKFIGTVCSYQGEKWKNEITQVLPKRKTITIYEEVNS